jgi:hypothetical protein
MPGQGRGEWGGFHPACSLCTDQPAARVRPMAHPYRRSPARRPAGRRRRRCTQQRGSGPGCRWSSRLPGARLLWWPRSGWCQARGPPWRSWGQTHRPPGPPRWTGKRCTHQCEPARQRNSVMSSGPGRQLCADACEPGPAAWRVSAGGITCSGEARLLVGIGEGAQVVGRGRSVGRKADHKVVQLQRHAHRHQEGGGDERVRARACLARDGKLTAPRVWGVGDGVTCKTGTTRGEVPCPRSACRLDEHSPVPARRRCYRRVLRAMTCASRPGLSGGQRRSHGHAAPGRTGWPSCPSPRC